MFIFAVCSFYVTPTMAVPIVTLTLSNSWKLQYFGKTSKQTNERPQKNKQADILGVI